MKRLAALLCLALILTCPSGCESPTDIIVEIESPLQVRQGEEFLVKMTVINTATEPQALVDVDIGDSYLEGIAVISTDPNPKEVFHTPIVKMMTYSFNQDILPGGSTVITYHMKALKPGDFNANIDFCINSSTTFLTKTIRTLVE